MASSPPQETCFHHRDRPTGRRCTRCGRPACSECLHDAVVGSHCWECIKAARPPVRQRVRMWNAQSGPIVASTLVVINVVAYVLTSLRQGGGGGQSLQTRLSLYRPAVASGEWYRLISSGFVHYNIVHIAFNMLLLYQLGVMLEPALGRIQFTALYFASLLCGSLGALILEPHALSGGASGAVFGLFGAAAVALHKRGVNVWQTSIGALIIINLVLTFAIPNISIGGHLGGLIGGALCGAAMFQARPSLQASLQGAAVAVAIGAAAFFGAIQIAAR